MHKMDKTRNTRYTERRSAGRLLKKGLAYMLKAEHMEPRIPNRTIK